MQHPKYGNLVKLLNSLVRDTARRNAIDNSQKDMYDSLVKASKKLSFYLCRVSRPTKFPFHKKSRHLDYSTSGTNEIHVTDMQ